MEKLPFTVSARTARLIGRENVASARGAIIELVKNAYDADASKCLVIFDVPLTDDTQFLSNTEWSSIISRLEKSEICEKDFSAYFEEISDGRKKIENLSPEQDQSYRNLCRQLSSIYIIDGGEGMTSDVIKNHWMVIGTQNKLANFTSVQKRIKSGAKGIGRFALDRLGARCEMISFTQNPSVQALKWMVDWDEFEGEGKKIGDVSAALYNIETPPRFLEYLLNTYPTLSSTSINELSVNISGTCLCITHLRDDWSFQEMNNLFNDLAILTPPDDNESFSITLENVQKPHEYGKVVSSICDNFDYKLTASVNKEGELFLHIIRNEYDIIRLPDDFFKREKMRTFPYTRAEFSEEGFHQSKPIFSLLPANKSNLLRDSILKLGPFSLTLYYLKRSVQPAEITQYFYRDINYQSFQRQQWLETFKGIKIFRDNFRVRPYGDPRESAFDWLSLGSRKAKSPAGVGRNVGGYRIEVNNLSGVIKISRIYNPYFEDKSSREGLQEGDAFILFKQLIIGIISELEKDRSYIAQELKSYYDEKDKASMPEDIKAGERMVDELTRKRKPANQQNIPHEMVAMAKYAQQQRQIVLELQRTIREEQALLRAMASNGLVMATFGHDFGHQSAIRASRMQQLKKTLERYLSEEDLIQNGCRDAVNPFKMMSIYEEDDYKIAAWIDFAVKVARKDKRNRKKISLQNYLKKLQDNWKSFLSVKDISLYCEAPQNVEVKGFEIDLDSIFNNLIINSVDAFIKSKEERKIYIKCTQVNTRCIEFNYGDSGPGLSPDLLSPDMIFEPLFTTKRDPKTGEAIGTGLGMWIVRKIIQDYSGSVILNNNKGFNIIFRLNY